MPVHGELYLTEPPALRFARGGSAVVKWVVQLAHILPSTRCWDGGLLSAVIAVYI